MGRKKGILSIMVLLVSMFACLALTGQEAGAVTVKVDGSFGQTEARAMLDMINGFRAGPETWYWQNGTKTEVRDLVPLQYDYELERAAMQRAAEIALCFNRARPDGKDYRSVSASVVLENFAMGYSTAAEAFEAWKEIGSDSQNSRQNMLNYSCDAVGIGHFVVSGVHFWVQEFGKKSSAAATAANNAPAAVMVELSDADISQCSVLFMQNTAAAYSNNGSQTLRLSFGEVRTDTKIAVRIYTKGTKITGWIPLADELVWTVSDPGIVQISGGKITAAKAGTAYLTAKLAGRPLSLVVIADPIDLAGAQVKISDVEYNGTAQKPTETVTLGGKNLVRDQDYRIDYENNTEVGTATVTLTGIGNYAGQKQATFKITKANLSGAVVGGISDQIYTGDAIVPGVKVTEGSEKLAKGSDYTVTYENNTKAGTGKVTIKGKGNYTGTQTVTFRIVKMSLARGKKIKNSKTGASYKVTKKDESGKATVEYTAPLNKKKAAVTIPATITHDGVTYLVTSVAKNAFKNNSAVKKLTIAKNVTKIGAGAFAGCKNLKTVVIKTTGLTTKSVGANAFKGIQKKAVIKVPAVKVKDYKTLLRKKGLAKTATVKK